MTTSTKTAKGAMLNNRTTKEMTTFTFTRETLENGKVYFDRFSDWCKNDVLDLEAIANQERYCCCNCGCLTYEEVMVSLSDEADGGFLDKIAKKLEEMGGGACIWNSNRDEFEYFTEEELANLTSVCFDGDSYEVVELDSDNIKEVLTYVNEEIREYDDQVRFLNMIWGSYDDLARYSHETRKWKPVQYLEEL